MTDVAERAARMADRKLEAAGTAAELLESEIERLAELSSLDYERVRKDEAKRLTMRANVLDKQVALARKKITKTETTDDPPNNHLIERWEDAAQDIIASNDVLAVFEEDWHRLIAGEAPNAKILFLIGVSRLFPKTMHAAIKGPSSVGKSEIRSAVLSFFPPESVVSFTTLSEKALLYTEDDFQHKILSMGEAAGADEQTLQDYLLRELMSEGRLRYPVVQKVSGNLETITIEKNGPVSFLVTTTRNQLHAENETRMLSLEVDDSQEQTRAVLKKVAEIEGLNAASAKVDTARWYAFHRWLEAGNRVVTVPYAPALSDLIPPRAVRLRRDLGQFIRAIKSHALIHRRHRPCDDFGQIVADIDRDYAAVRGLMHDLLRETSEATVSPRLKEIAEAVGKATFGLKSDGGASAADVGKLLNLDKSAARRRLWAAVDLGLVVNLETRKGRPGRYRLASGVASDEVEMLPSTDALKRYLASPPSKSLPPCHHKGQASDIEDKTGGKSGGNGACHPCIPATAAPPSCHHACHPIIVHDQEDRPGGGTVARVSGGYERDGSFSVPGSGSGGGGALDRAQQILDEFGDGSVDDDSDERAAIQQFDG